MSDQLLINQRRGLVHVALNRPDALNALSVGMIEGLLPILQGDTPVLVTGVGGRAFCSGGDVKAVWHALKAGGSAAQTAHDYFRHEYRVNAALYGRARPYVSYLNGIAMGGGYGISAHGSHIIVCEATQFAMPEVKIGFFPDVGAAYPLSRTPHQLGTWLGVTGNTIGADDMLFAGLADAFVPQADFDAFADMMADAGIERAIAAFGKPAPANGIFRQHAEVIARCFAFDTMEEIVHALHADGGHFALQTLADIAARSPLSMKVALKHLRLAAKGDFESVIARDVVLAQKFMETPDFMEGVRAALIDKDRKPRWKPQDLAGVTEEMLGLYFDTAQG